MNKQEQLEQLKKQVAILEKEIDNKSVIQIIPAVKLEWGETAEELMNWNDAKKWCKEQGEGWRLPTRVELLQAYKEKIKGFVASTYWSSTECSTYNAWVQYFSNGNQTYNSKTSTGYVRCVRSL